MADGFGPGDWTSAVEQAVAAEFRRRQTWARWAIGIAAATGAVALALLAWQARGVPAQTRAIAGEVSADAVDRRVAPLLKTDAEIYANQVALARHQVDLDRRLKDLEAEAERLQRTLRVGAVAPVRADALPADIRRLPAAQWRQQLRIDELERRVRELERLSAAAARPDGAATATGR